MRRIKSIVLTLFAALGLNACGKPAHWLTYRHDAERDGNQFFESALSDPVKVLIGLHVGWQAPGPGWTASPPGPFRASPIVFNGNRFHRRHQRRLLGDKRRRWRLPLALSGDGIGA